MAIYRNENVNSLPEQVQENKKNIKNIEEAIERIDPEAITAVIEQVETNKNDISNIKAEQVVQNTAIGGNATAINNEKTARESVVGVNVSGNTYLKTATAGKQIIIQNNGNISILSENGNALILTPQDVELSSVDTIVSCIRNEGVKIQTNTSAHNPFELVLKNTGDFEVKNGHVLKFNTNGELLIDNNPVVPHLYCNTISASFDDEDNESGYMYITIYSNEKIENINDLKAYIDNYNSNNKLSITGYRIAGAYSIIAIYSIGVNAYEYTNNNDENKYFTFDENNTNFKSIKIF